MKRLSMAVSLLAIALSAAADTNTIDDNLGAKFLLTGGYTYGGDKIATIEYEYGDHANIRAGGEFLLGLGMSYRFTPSWELQLSFHYQYDREEAENGEMEFHRVPIELLGFYRQGVHRFGGGVTYHTNSEFESDFDEPDDYISVGFDDALGFVLEYDYLLSDMASLGIRYTNIEYQVSGFSNKVDGSYVGLMFNLYF